MRAHRLKKYSLKVSSLLISLVLMLSSFGDIHQAFAAYPIISGVSSGSVTSVSAIITWATDINANSLVDYGQTTAYGYTSGDAINRVTSHSVELSGLIPGTTYRFRVRSADSTGNETTDDNGGAGYQFSTAPSPVISNVHLADVGNNYATIDWNTDIAAYPYLAYGLTTSYGKLVGDEENLNTSHSLSIAGLTLGATYHYKPRVKDIYGNFTYYGTDNVFTVGAPHLQSFTSSTADSTYGPSENVNITANYSESLAAGSTITVVLNTGVSVTLNTVSGTTLTGTYTVGATGSGENTDDLTVSSITSQSACDSNPYCNTSTTLPTTNLGAGSDIGIDTTAPVFSSVQPADSSYINNVTDNSDISYTLSEDLASGTILITQTGGTADGGSPHTCTLTGTALTSGAHNNFDTTDCSEGAITLVNGAIYTFDFDGSDASGNNATAISRTGVTFDTVPPSLQSFTSSTTDGTYGPSENINVTANYSESLAAGSTITVVLNTGVSVTLSTVSGTTLTGTYVVGATGSGQNTNDLTVGSIDFQNTCDIGGNCQTGSSLPETNIADGSDIVIDTIAPNAPGLVLFVTDPVNKSNEHSATLRVNGEAGATIDYSIDDTDGGTSPVTGAATMDGDGSTDVTGIDLSSLVDGTLTATVFLRDPAGNDSSSSQDSVTKDATDPSFTVQYYSDAGLTNPMGSNPHLKTGTYYLKITAAETLAGTPTVSINAQGSANDVLNASTASVSGNDYVYARTIASDAAADGTALEAITITGTDTSGNTATNSAPTNSATGSAYTDTTKPTVSGSANPFNAKAGTVTINLTVNEAADQSVSPTVLLRKQDSTTLAVTGSYTGPTAWSGTATINSSDANGTTHIEVSGAADAAGNVMDSNSNAGSFLIDTVDPSFTINAGTDPGPVKNDTINITTSDSGSGIASQYYGFSPDNACDAGDTLNNAFTSGTDFTISGDHTDYLCATTTDNAGNTAYQLVGQLNTDNTPPTIISVSSTKPNGQYNAGTDIPIDVTFSEPVTSSDVTVSLETGTTDRGCTFSISGSTSGSCTYTVQSGDTSSDLNTNLISGTISDQAGNALTNFTPATNLAANKNIIIDTTSPNVNILSPLNGNHVNGNAAVYFSDDDPHSPQCSFDNVNWSACSSGVTTLFDITGWNSLPDGSFTLYLRDTDLAGNIGTDNETGIIKDTAAPRISNITSTHSDGRFKTGEVIDVELTFSRNVTSTGNVTVVFDTTQTGNRFCTFQITDSDTASCDYTVQPGDNSPDLNVSAVTGTIVDQIGNALVDFIPVVNLADNKDIIIDTAGPIISDISSNHADGTFTIGEVIRVNVTLDEIATSTGFLTVTLDTGGSCTFTLTNSSFGYCDYTVTAGQNSPDLNVANVSGTVYDQIGNQMINFTPVANLADNKNIVIDTTNPGNPTITNVTSSKANGSYKSGEIIPIDVTFSEPVTSSDLVTVTLETGTTDRSCTFTLSNTTSASCNYVVQDGDASSKLNVNSIAGPIYDQASNPMINFTPATNLADNKNIVIDTTKPATPSIVLLDPITDANKDAATITGTGEANATINYSIDDTNPITTAKTGTGTVSALGNINLTGIDLTGLDGGTLTATLHLTDAAGNVSDDTTDTATSAIVLPTITNITSSTADGAYGKDAVIPIDITFSEPVTSSGDVTVVLETGTTDRSCTFTVSNSTTASCDYTVQDGDNSVDLNINSISGSIADQASNPMINFTPATNLADNKNIVIDTTKPATPSIVLLDPITDANKDAATITGTGEANATINYSIDDTNPITTAKTGTGTVSALGNINLTGIDLTGLDGGTLTATLHLTDAAGNVSDDTTDTATSAIVLPTITNITSSTADGAYSVGQTIDIDLTFSENITSSGLVTVTMETGATDRSCNFSVSDSTAASCNYVVQPGDTSPDLTVLSVSGVIADQAGNPMVDSTPVTNLAANKNIVIDTTELSLLSFTSTTPNGTYGPATDINITATYDKTLAAGSTMTVELSTGRTVTLDTVSGSTLSGTYTVGAPGSGEGTTDLAVTQIDSQNSCDLASNCLTTTSLPGINISDGSNIAIDAISPVFSEVAPLNSSNIQSITGSGSDISYTLSETLGSGTIIITRTAWAADPGSPHTCTLTGAALQIGEHANFDTTDCAEGAISLSAGAVYTFSFDGQDLFGNPAVQVNKTGVSFGLDLTPPVISNVTITNITSSSATVTWDTDENSNSLVDYGTSTAYGKTSGDIDASTTTHSVELSGLLPGTDYKLRIRSTDASNNTAVDDNGGNGYDLATVSSPTISNIDVTDITASSAIVNWSTSADAYGYVEYGTTTSYGKIVGSEDALVSDHSIPLSGLAAETTYHFRIRIRDAYGNYSVSGDQTFDTLAASEDSTPPVISDVAVAQVFSDSATITWSTDEPADSYVEYGTTTSYGGKYGNDTLTTSHSITLPASLAEKTLYHFRVQSSDSSGNKSVSDDSTFTTTAATSGDTGGGTSTLKISGTKVSNITSSTATISWKTSQNGNGIVRYGLDKKYGYSSAEDATVGAYADFSKSHEVILTNLLSNTKYNYTVISYDANGNIAISKNLTFSTSTMSSISKVTVGDVTLTSATIIWETGDPATSEIDYGRTTAYGQTGGDNKTLTNSHKVELTGLATGQDYHFRVRGLLKQDNLISSDDYVFATYPKPLVQNYELKAVTDADATVAWTTNIPTESTVEYVNVNDPSDTGSQGLPGSSADHEIRLIGLAQGSEYQARIKGIDINNNSFESQPFTIKTDKDVTPPIISRVNTEASLANKKDDQVQAIIFWKTDEPSSSQVFYDVGMSKSDEYGQNSKKDDNLTTNHLVVLTNLKPGLVYRFKVVSSDKNGNTQNSDTYSLLTPRKDQSVIQLIIANFEQTFGWIKNIKVN